MTCMHSYEPTSDFIAVVHGEGLDNYREDVKRGDVISCWFCSDIGQYCVCGEPATMLCDYPDGEGTCDAPLCPECSRHVGDDLDECEWHRV